MPITLPPVRAHRTAAHRRQPILLQHPHHLRRTSPFTIGLFSHPGSRRTTSFFSCSISPHYTHSPPLCQKPIPPYRRPLAGFLSFPRIPYRQPLASSLSIYPFVIHKGILVSCGLLLIGAPLLGWVKPFAWAMLLPLGAFGLCLVTYEKGLMPYGTRFEAMVEGSFLLTGILAMLWQIT